jgi:hypothetical protein
MQSVPEMRGQLIECTVSAGDVPYTAGSVEVMISYEELVGAEGKREFMKKFDRDYANAGLGKPYLTDYGLEVEVLIRLPGCSPVRYQSSLN